MVETWKLTIKKQLKSNKTYNLLLWNIVEEDEVAEHGGEAEQPQARHDHDHRVLLKEGIAARG